MHKTMRKIICLALLVLPGGAVAQQGNPLDGAPAVRHRQELRQGRFEIGPSVNFSLNRLVRHSILVGGKLQYHLLDWLSVGGDFGYGIGLDTGLTDELKDSYSNNIGQWAPIEKAFSDVQFAGDIRVSATPLSGKLALFSKLFLAYDFYGFGGVALAITKNRGSGSDFNRTDVNWGAFDVDAANEGFRIGGAVGVGMHLYFTEFFSMGVEFKDLIFSDNETGGDLTRGLEGAETEGASSVILVNADDRRLTNHYYVGVNFTFFLPSKAAISN